MPYLTTADLITRKQTNVVSGWIRSFQWVTDGRLLFTIVSPPFSTLWAADSDGKNQKSLLELVDIDYDRSKVQLARVIALKTTEPDCVLVERSEHSVFDKSSLRRPSVWRVNYCTGKLSLVEKNPGNVVRWLTDGHGEVRAGVAVTKDKFSLLYRSERQQPWRTLLESKSWEKLPSPLGFTPDADQLYVAASNGGDTLGVHILDPASATMSQCLWQHDQYDARVSIFGTQGRLDAVIYESDRPQIAWLNETARATQAKVDRTLPDTVNLPVSASQDGSRLVYLAFSDRLPGRYYLADMNRRQLNPLDEVADWVKPEDMAEMKPIQYTARDGLRINGYLTLPVGSSGKNLPMIVMPHGGPWLRDSWQFDPEVQFFANRGYAVLQMNFRGSAGYGLKFLKAGFKEFGRKMQDDITDGVQWAIDQGIADKNRIAIYGMSYGGYAALMGLIATPQLYRCGISYAGVTDLRATVKRMVSRMPKPFAAMPYEMIGDYRSEEAEIEAVSPLEHVDQIRAPVFLAYGGKDPIVDVSQGKKLASALKRQKKPYELVIEAKEGHGFLLETNRCKLFLKIEAFLKNNL